MEEAHEHCADEAMLSKKNEALRTAPERIRAMHFIIARYLSAGPCQRAAQVLLEEMQEHKLHMTRTDWEGRSQTLTFDESQQRYNYTGSGGSFLDQVHDILYIFVLVSVICKFVTVFFTSLTSAPLLTQRMNPFNIAARYLPLQVEPSLQGTPQMLCLFWIHLHFLLASPKKMTQCIGLAMERAWHIRRHCWKYQRHSYRVVLDKSQGCNFREEHVTGMQYRWV